MDENKQTQDVTPEESGYTPRPAYQVWMARVGLVFMILFVIYQIFSIATGGLS